MKLLIFFAAFSLDAQSNVLSDAAKAEYRSIEKLVIRSAEKMPESDYAFKPTPDVRNFGQQIAHIADDQYNYCADVKGEKRNAAYSEIEQTLSTKAELVPAVKKAFAYCDAVYGALTDANASTIVPANKRNKPRLSILYENIRHTWLHYGNLVVYFRLKGMTPPSSER